MLPPAPPTATLLPSRARARRVAGLGRVKAGSWMGLALGRSQRRASGFVSPSSAARRLPCALKANATTGPEPALNRDRDGPAGVSHRTRLPSAPAAATKRPSGLA